MFQLDRFLPYRLAVLASRTSRAFAQVYGQRFGLSIPEWRVMVHLAEAGVVSVRDIRKRVDMDKSKVSRAATRLEDRGLVHKRTNPQDKRLLELTLSEAGQAMFEQIVPLALDFQAERLRRLAPEDIVALNRIMDTLLEPGDDDCSL